MPPVALPPVADAPPLVPAVPPVAVAPPELLGVFPELESPQALAKSKANVSAEEPVRKSPERRESFMVFPFSCALRTFPSPR
jgi:hypothetical protein